MKYLITGGCGFLGSNLAEYLISRGDEVAVFDNLKRHGSELNLEWLKSKGSFLWTPGDVRNQNDIENVMRTFQPEFIFHLAGQVAMTTSIENPRLDFETNVLGTFNVLEAVRKLSPKTGVIYSSTNKVYGDLNQFHYDETATRYVCKEFPKGFDEKTPLDFHSPYGTSKGSADQYMLDYARIFGLKTVVFRHSSIFGQRQFSTADQGWVGWFVKKALEAKTSVRPFQISGTGKQVRDVLFSEDLISCYIKASEAIEKICGQAFNIGGGIANSLSLLELFSVLEEALGVEMKFERLPWRLSDQKIFVADISKAQSLFGWTPEISCREGVGRMIQWVTDAC